MMVKRQLIERYQLAESMGTNASHVRKLSGLLRKAGIVQSRKGSAGLRLVPDSAELTMLEVYLAVCETDHVELLDVHRNPSNQCIVGRHIAPVLGGMFKDLEEEAARELRSRTLADCIAALRAHAAQTNDLEGLTS